MISSSHTAHNKHMKRKSVPSAGFEPATPAIEGPQTYALDRTALRVNILYLIIWLHALSVLQEIFCKLSSLLRECYVYSPCNFTRVNRSIIVTELVVVWWSPVAARFVSSAQRHDIRAKFWHRQCCIMCAPPPRQQQQVKESNRRAKNNNRKAILGFPACHAQ